MEEIEIDVNVKLKGTREELEGLARQYGERGWPTERTRKADILIRQAILDALPPETFPVGLHYDVTKEEAARFGGCPRMSSRGGTCGNCELPPSWPGVCPIYQVFAAFREAAAK